MTFNYLAAIESLATFNLIKNTDKTVIDIGSQTPDLNVSFLDFILRNNSHFDENQKKKISLLKKIIKEKKTFSTKDFFLAAGFSNYESIDINGAYGSFKFDLNLNLNLVYNFHNNYDLVINNGTGEHIFNQYSLFLNIHKLVKVNGLMLHILPFIDWINHGFYNFNPIFFADLASANQYEIIKLSFANRNGLQIYIEKKDYNLFFEQIKFNSKNDSLKKIIDLCKDKLGMNTIIVALLRKKSHKEFKIPLQGKYLSDIKNSNEFIKYNTQKDGSSKAKNQIADNEKRRKN